MMLTRSFLLKVLSSFDEYIHTYYPQSIHMNNPLYIEAEKENTNKNKEQKGNKSKVRYTNNIEKTDNQDIELYKSIEDLLISVNLQFDKKTQRTQMRLVSKERYTASIILDVVLLKKIIDAIKYSIPNMEWGISAHF